MRPVRSKAAKNRRTDGDRGFSLVELIVAMALTALILGVAVATFSGVLGSRERESSKTDALTSAQAALNLLSREVGNAGYGLSGNGLVFADCTDKRVHFRSNVENGGNSMLTDVAGEDVTYFYDDASQSVVRHDRFSGTSGIINRVSDVDFIYYNYADDGTFTAGAASAQTGRVNIALKVILADVQGQPTNQTVRLTSDVTLRNSTYMLGQY
jgi:prepilin-type N-terminal cleavage/methylation domain-containing protein